jgi:hypothetical protein
MRERIFRELWRNADVPAADGHDDFLVYLMGPYRSLDERVVSEDVNTTFDPSEIRAKSYLERLRDGLRQRGYDAFIATDPEIPMTEINGLEQSLRFALASDAVVFVLPYLTENEGVAMEISYVLPKLTLERQRRVLVCREVVDERKDVGVSSAMLADDGNDWEFEDTEFADGEELSKSIRQFVYRAERDR